MTARAVSRLTALSQDVVGSGADVGWSFAFTPASQVASVTRDNDAYAWTGHYNVSRSYSVNGLNQYTLAGGASFAYDANGNLTNGGSSAFLYDIENRWSRHRARRRRRCAMIRSAACMRPPAHPAPPGSSMTATRWSPSMTVPATCCGVMCTGPGWTARWPGSRVPALAPLLPG